MSVRNRWATAISLSFLIVLVLCAAPLLAADVNQLILTGSTKEVIVQRFLEVIPDSSATDSFETVRSRDSARRFVTFDPVRRSLRAVGIRYWFRLTVLNRSQNPEWILAFLPTSHVETEVYLPDASGGYSRHTTSASAPFADREIAHRYVVYPIDMSPGSEQTIYLHMFAEQNYSMGIWSYEGFLRRSRDDQLLLGLFYGMALAMALYNLFLFISLRDTSHLYYALFVLFFSLLLAYWDGTALEYVHPRSVSTSGNISVNLFGNLAAASAFLFIRRFLNARRYTHALDGFLIGFAAFFAAVSSLYFIVHSPLLEMISAAVMIPGVILFFASVGFVLARGFRPARYVLYGMAPALVSTLVTGLNNLGLMVDLQLFIPIVYVSFALALVLFSLALADRINVVRRERQLSESLNTAKTEFFVKLSHEVKTPLTIIANYLDSYMREHEYSDELFVMKRAVDKLSRDMAQFFDVLRFEKGSNLSGARTTQNFADMVSSRVSLFSKLAEAHGVTFTSQIDEGVCITADPVLLNRVVDNLLENAVKYNRRGGRVCVRLRRTDREIVFDVVDTGIGIDADNLPQIFEPYYQVSTSKRSSQGIGLGLYLVRQIMESLGGSVQAESTPGVGSTFSVTFTSEESCEDLEPGEELDVRPSAPLSSLPAVGSTVPLQGDEPIDPLRPTVLVAEDNVDLLALICSALKDRYNVLAASSGLEALEKLRAADACAVVVSDIMMDDIDGYELLDRLQADSRYERIPCIFISAKSSRAERLAGLQRGAIDYIDKPFPLDELLLKVDAFIKHRQHEQKRQEREQLLALRALVSGFAHEIRNPLSGITGPLENIKRLLSKNGSLDDPQLAKHLRFLTQSAGKIRDITATLRVLAGDRGYVNDLLNMGEIVESAFSTFRDSTPPGVHFDIQLDQRARLVGDSGVVELILRNLISNALEAVGERGTVTVRVTHTASRDFIVVCDNGVGMAAEVKERIFDAFYSRKATGVGMGVGLFLVKRFCSEMGWHINVESRPERGTEFTIGPVDTSL